MATKDIQIYELYEALDEDLLRIVDKTFAITVQFYQKHMERFSKVGATLTTIENNYSLYETYLKEGIKLYEVFEKVFKDQAHAKETWQVHLFAPLLRLSCLHGCPSGLQRYDVAEHINVCKESRDKFTSGVQPDLCDGWISSNITRDGQRKIDEVKMLDWSYDPNVLPRGCMDCGDPLLKMLDVLAELNGSDAEGREMHKSKLLCEMAVSSQCFNEVLNENPYIFGFTTSGPRVRFYALKSTSEAKSNNVEYCHGVEQPASVVTNQKEDTPQSPLAKLSDAPDQPLDDKWHYDCFFLEDMEITDFQSFVRLLNLLWRIRVYRKNAVRSWLFKSKLSRKKDTSSQTDNDILFTAEANTCSSTKNRSDNEEDKTQLDVTTSISRLKQQGFTNIETLAESKHAIVLKAMISESPCVVKLFKDRANFETEKKIYDWLDDYNFKHKPDLIKTIDEVALVLELVEGVDESQIKSSDEIVTFAFHLLQAVEALHAREVIHGDIKISNLAYDKASGSIKLFDFAYSEILTCDDEVERRGYTFGYLPKWFGYISFRDDLFNVGATLFRLIYCLSPGDIGYDDLLEFMAGSTTIKVQPLLHHLVRTLIDPAQESALQHEVFADLRNVKLQG